MGGDWTKYNWFWNGVKDDFNQCCIFWFMMPWMNLDKDVRRNWTSTGEGYIPCPDCLVRHMEIANGEIK